MSDTKENKTKEAVFPPAILEMPENKDPTTSIQEFVKRDGWLYANGHPNDSLASPFTARCILPGGSSALKDMSGVRREFPVWNNSICNECGSCITACPDNALLGKINTLEEVCATNIEILEKAGHDVKLLKKHIAPLAETFRTLSKESKKETNVSLLFRKSVDQTIEKSGLLEAEKEQLKKLGKLFLETFGDFKFRLTSAGGLFSITLDPWACKGCMLCNDKKVCSKSGLPKHSATDKDTEHLKKEFEYQKKLPKTNSEFLSVDLEESTGDLQSILLDKENLKANCARAGTCVGCGEQEPIRLLNAVITALHRPRVEKFMRHLEELITELTEKIGNFIGKANLHSEEKIQEVVDALNAVDYKWYLRAINTLVFLKQLHWKYEVGINGEGRSDMIFDNSTGCSSVAGGTSPNTPYKFPWMNNLFQDAPTTATAHYLGEMRNIAEDFKAVRIAELILADETEEKKYDFTYFDHKQFTEEERLLCPTIVALGGDGAMYDIGFQNLSRLMASGLNVKVLVLDTGVYSNTGGQTSTAGPQGQIADLSPYGKVSDGKQEARKELALVAMAHRTTYVLQGSTADANHLISGYVEGLNFNGPAVFNVYCACPPEHIIADDAGVAHSIMARDSRMYPQFKFHPWGGKKPWRECLSLEGNPDIELDWPTYELAYKNVYGETEKMVLPFTFADFAVTEGRFKNHFKKEKADTWTPEMVPLAEYLELEDDEREGLIPYILGVDAKENLIRVVPSKTMVDSCADRKSFWRLLKEFAGLDRPVPPVETKTEEVPVVTEVKTEIPVEKVTSKVVTIDTENCTVCDKCFKKNKKVFGKREEDGKAIVLNPKAGTFKEIVEAALECKDKLIHPGTPQNPNEKGLEKLLAKAKKIEESK
jgi:pyruvate-ferredoxin/flavodoxin oxidoreductase